MVLVVAKEEEEEEVKEEDPVQCLAARSRGPKVLPHPAAITPLSEPPARRAASVIAVFLSITCASPRCLAGLSAARTGVTTGSTPAGNGRQTVKGLRCPVRACAVSGRVHTTYVPLAVLPSIHHPPSRPQHMKNAMGGMDSKKMGSGVGMAEVGQRSGGGSGGAGSGDGGGDEEALAGG
ncbi:hypothetical protein O3P69_013825 [Scylla paramamosain]|uniref:Uncharacterized protein n=1 Tax=Scylla paramamosain TaxID=85552 RepID=A0AAW0SRR4_SCYPA